MKTSAFFLTLFSAVCFSNLSSFAKIHTVNNNLSGPGIFTTIQDAHDAAASGDTIYLASSPSAYAGATISKKIAIFGAGMRPGEKKDNSASSFLSGGFTFNTGADNSMVVGIHFNGQGINFSGTLTGIQILRNYFSSGCAMLNFNAPSFTGFIVANNFFNQTGCCCSSIHGNNRTFTNMLIQNNVFTDNTGCGCEFVLRGFANSANCIFSNNVVYGDQTTDIAFSSVSNFIIENNIFHTTSGAGASNCVMNNNITFGTGQDAMPYGSNSGQSNVANTDPQMSSFVNSNKTPFQNFQPAGGPAKTGAVGGGQMGVYGGSFNWNNSAVPPIPQIKNFSITSGSTVPAGGSMTIKVTSTKQN